MSKIAVGFPKLAICKIDGSNYFPRYCNDWVRTRVSFSSGELIVLIASFWRGDERFYFVPVIALEKKIVPITAIINWTKSYTYFPLIRKENIEILHGKRTT